MTHLGALDRPTIIQQTVIEQLLMYQSLTRKEGEKGKMANKTIETRLLGKRINGEETY